MDEGSSLCLACLDTVVIDNQDAAPLYAEARPRVLQTEHVWRLRGASMSA